MSVAARVAVIRRMHLRSLRDRPVPALLAALGIALGAALVVATQLLTASIVHPFEAVPTFATSRHSSVREVRSPVQDRVAGPVLDDLSKVDGIGGVARVWTAVTPASTDGRSPSVRLVAVDDPHRILPSIDLPAGALAPAGGAPTAATPVVLLEPAADALHVRVGEPIDLPGLPRHALVVAAVMPAPAPWSSLDGGRVVLVSPAALAGLLGTGSDASLAYVDPGRAAPAALDAALAGRATLADPAATLPAAIGTVKDALSSLSVCGIVIGFLIAANTLLVAAGERTGSLAAASLIGAGRRQVLTGLATEGALVGLVGGLVAIPLGWALGWGLVHQYAATMLAGAGVTVRLVSGATILAFGPLTGLVVGALSGWYAGRRMLADPALAGQASAVDRSVSPVPKLWPALVGVAIVAAAAAVMDGLGRGYLPIAAGQAGLLLGAIGLILVGHALVPRIARRLVLAVERLAPVTARLTRAEIDAEPGRLGTTVTVLGLAAGIACGFITASALAVDATGDLVAARLGGGVMVTTQQPFDQRSSAFAAPVLAQIESTAGQVVSVRSRALLRSVPARAVLGITPTPAGVATLVATADPAGLARALAGGQVALSELAANRLGVRAGDRVTLPTLQGKADFQVAAVTAGGLPDDSTVGDWVIASGDLAGQRWGAEPVAVVLDGRPAEVAPAVDAATEALTFDGASWAAGVTPHLDRYFAPFTLTAWAFLLTAAVAVANLMLLQLLGRRRQRAVLVAVGRDDGEERRVLVFGMAVNVGLGALLAFASAATMTWLLALASPAYYGFRLPWGVAPPALAVAGVALVGTGLVAVLAPLAAASRIEPAPALRAE
jgi:putative ABC transport system permease protein